MRGESSTSSGWPPERRNQPLRVSTPHELKSCPSTSPTHPGLSASGDETCVAMHLMVVGRSARGLGTERSGKRSAAALAQRTSERAVHTGTSAWHAAGRRRGGIESLRVSTPHELKSCPSTSPTHPGNSAQELWWQSMCVLWTMLVARGWTGKVSVAAGWLPDREYGVPTCHNS